MKTFVINLPDRKDRMQRFNANNPYLEYETFKAVEGYKVGYEKLLSQGFDTDHNWIDPILKTPLTKGEVGCFLSHWHLWNKCIEKNEPIIVLEDDAILTDKFDVEEISKLKYDFVYLGWKEMDKSKEINDDLVIPVYPYWTLAYMIRPEAARVLVNDVIKCNIIPVDEYLPTKMPEIKVAGYKENVVEPVSREDGGSDVLAKSRYDYFLDFNTHAVTVATDKTKALKLYESAKAKDSTIINLGKNITWEGGVMEAGKGGGHKINLVKEYIADKKDSDVLVFFDGYDTFLSESIEEITYRFMEFSERAIFSSERFCWPDESLAQELKAKNNTQETPYQYLNSGTYVARIGELKKIFEPHIENDGDDQLYVQKQHRTGKYDIACDVEGYIFTCYEPQIEVRNGQLFNPVTGCYTCAYHGNGGEKQKVWMSKVYNQYYGFNYIPTRKYDILSDDMILIDFMSKDMCENMISLAEKKTFRIMEGDKVPSQDLRLKEFDQWEKLKEHWNKIVYEIVWDYWHPCHMWGLRDAFIIKYEMDKQRELRVHNDASLVTGSVKLNDDYEGGILEFPRQGITNKDIPVGKCLLFPGQVTHGHLSTKLESGIKYSLTIWSSRYEGDIN